MKSFKIEDIVYKLLLENISARSDDMYLYYCYITEVSTIQAMPRIFLSSDYRKLHNIATFQAIERVGRKVRKEHPELNPKAKQKLEMTENYIDYSFGRNVEIF